MAQQPPAASAASAAAVPAVLAAMLYVRPPLLDTLEAKMSFGKDAGASSVFELISDNLRAIAEKRDEYLFQMVLNAQDAQLRKRDSARWAAFEIDLMSMLFNNAGQNGAADRNLVITGLLDSRTTGADGTPTTGIVEFWQNAEETSKPAALEQRAAAMLAAYATMREVVDMDSETASERSAAGNRL